MMFGPSDPLGWAKHPRSRTALESVRRLAQKDKQFRRIWQQLVKDGVATADGKAIQLWDGNGWVKVKHG